MENNGLQKAIDQLGEMAVMRYLPKGMKMHNCDLHGGFLCHYKDPNPLCPLCNKEVAECDGNGTTATDMEHYIDMKDNPIEQIIEAVAIANQ